MRNIVACALVFAVVLSNCYGVPLGGRGYGGGGGYESHYNYGYSGWRGGLGAHRPLGLFPLGGYKHLKGPGWRGDYGYGGYGGYGPGYGHHGGGAVSSATASASAGGGGLFGGGASNSHAHSETASFNLGPLSATFSKSNANANALGR